MSAFTKIHYSKVRGQDFSLHRLTLGKGRAPGGSAPESSVPANAEDIYWGQIRYQPKVTSATPTHMVGKSNTNREKPQEFTIVLPKVSGVRVSKRGLHVPDALVDGKYVNQPWAVNAKRFRLPIAFNPSEDPEHKTFLEGLDAVGENVRAAYARSQELDIERVNMKPCVRTSNWTGPNGINYPRSHMELTVDANTTFRFGQGNFGGVRKYGSIGPFIVPRSEIKTLVVTPAFLSIRMQNFDGLSLDSVMYVMTIGWRVAFADVKAPDPWLPNEELEYEENGELTEEAKQAMIDRIRSDEERRNRELAQEMAEYCDAADEEAEAEAEAQVDQEEAEAEAIEEDPPVTPAKASTSRAPPGAPEKKKRKRTKASLDFESMPGPSGPGGLALSAVGQSQSKSQPAQTPKKKAKTTSRGAPPSLFDVV